MKNKKNGWCTETHQYLGEHGWCSREQYLAEKQESKIVYKKIKTKGGQND